VDGVLLVPAADLDFAPVDRFALTTRRFGDGVEGGDGALAAAAPAVAAPAEPVAAEPAPAPVALFFFLASRRAAAHSAALLACSLSLASFSALVSFFLSEGGGEEGEEAFRFRDGVFLVAGILFVVSCCCCCIIVAGAGAGAAG